MPRGKLSVTRAICQVRWPRVHRSRWTLWPALAGSSRWSLCAGCWLPLPESPQHVGWGHLWVPPEHSHCQLIGHQAQQAAQIYLPRVRENIVCPSSALVFWGKWRWKRATTALFKETKSISLCSGTDINSYEAKLSATQENDGILISALKFRLKTQGKVWNQE